LEIVFFSSMALIKNPYTGCSINTFHPCPVQMGNAITKCVTNVERYNSFELLILIFQYVCPTWHAMLYLEVKSWKMLIWPKLTMAVSNKWIICSQELYQNNITFYEYSVINTIWVVCFKSWFNYEKRGAQIWKLGLFTKNPLN